MGFTEIEVRRDVTWQPSLLAIDEPDFDPTLTGARRRFLGRGAWVDVVPGWVTGADALFDIVLESAPWKAFERPMYDRVVDVPRLETRVWRDRPSVLDRMARCLGRRYGVRLPSISANLYRDGQRLGGLARRSHRRACAPTRSWRSSRSGPRARCCSAPTVAARRSRSRCDSGDLLVQGGTCQRTFEHCVPKRAHAGPRISVMFRQAGGN